MIDAVIASFNEKKVQEIQNFLYNHKLHSISKWHNAMPQETASTFIENAIIKARHASYKSRLPAIADDSGLHIDALGGMPGIRSARFSGGGDFENREKVKELLRSRGVKKSKAKFICTIVFMNHYMDSNPKCFFGELDGEVILEDSGKSGFGYDPIFFLPEHLCTMASLDLETKNKISHRAKALTQLAEHLR